MSGADRPQEVRFTTSSRRPDKVRADLQAWLAGRLGAGADPVITDLTAPERNGLSSETVLFDAEWTASGARAAHRLVARLAPPGDSFPVFPSYDLTGQFETMRLVGELSSVPVPRVLWDEPDPAALGTPFFVMERVDGQVPPDLMPYTFGDSWLMAGDAGQRRRASDSTVRALAELHRIPDPRSAFAFLDRGDRSASPLRRHVDASRAWLAWIEGDGPAPLLDRCFDWLDEHWPDEEPPAVVSWGDARIGNIIYADFRPAALLDWEMAGLGPGEIDLAWLVFLHRFFDDLAVEYGMEGMPGFLRRSDAERIYAEAAGRAPRDMDWYLVYAAARHGVALTRVSQRAVHFGEAEPPADPDAPVLHRATLEAMMSGAYWPALAADRK
ncbi:phosphotransferase family protein [Actinomadura parmotrematis]|uniref:Phosphotransferase family protein n=1 Tax=Actinomadura parmotrematis TaxID=2864039 RepID=A0ABS7G4S8_9ACTN|nr:phosphotransferase family protein [Actinomadura parmotrematis]MBW8487230.1 phosphotransferase family protein [Actinomadura parmotrematis]